ncbi:MULTISPECIES: aspartyl-phosphate phosphatase Spo0E family protein [Bacillus]|uniref:aspartyl-phosphate phosphatase Spo0E family protein n=1 Tax=Bacillus TaxID=1386 RepID=UPI00077B1B09|nr:MULTISPECIES: aspartyl-phosphate phosphatase Spo0E family protein [Bacillus cereus group]KXX90500.1 stage II sporulation protein E [Bacillus cereus]MBG9753236.1 stage II sporulation protein E [Bacillus thuringiensis]MBG9777989.1 stage II sporulation protein E [Bacillus thuringiensis]MBG9929422.1 stage II sporulation protein E [Bacillus thuringiensis]MCU4724921.1 aspartyl-phosphate phosphatase Spo0E family protein [Bacillus cereus]
MSNYKKLNQVIEKKEELISLVKQYGFTHEKIICYSRELDLLLYDLMKSNRNNK